MKLTLLKGRVIVAVKPEEDKAFANDPADTGDGILLPEHSCRMPEYSPESKKTTFTTLALRINAYDLDLGTPVICLAFRGRKGRWHAAAWAPTTLFEAAKDTYAVFKDTGEGEIEIWRGNVFELSRHYTSELWTPNSGIIWQSRNETYSIARVNAADDSYVNLQDDPRISEWQLPAHFLLHHLPRTEVEDNHVEAQND